MRNSRPTAAIIITAVLVSQCLVATATAQENDAAARFGDNQIKNLSAWKTSGPRDALEKNKEKWGDTAPYQTAWGVLLAHEGKLGDAMASLNKATNADKSDPAADFFRGNVLYWQKKYNDATAAWKRSNDRAAKILKDNPQDARASFYKGAALVGLGKYGEARKALDSALKNGFNVPMAKYQVGLSFYFEKNWNKAKEAFDKVIEKDNRFAYSYFYRGRTWDNLGRKDAMLVDMDQFVKLAPNAPDASKAKAILAASGR